MFCTIIFIVMVVLIDCCYQCLLVGYSGINASGNGVYEALEGVQAGLVSTV